MEAISIAKDDVYDLLEECHIEDFEFVAKQDICDTRWNKVILLVVRRVSDRKLFGAEYERGLTENQWAPEPFEEYTNIVPFESVVEKQVTAYELETVI
jgi:hypothetical protein